MGGNCFSQEMIRTRWISAVVIAVGLLLYGCGEQKPEVYRVGVLCGLDVLATTVDGFKERMTELGYVEGKDIVYDIHTTNFDTKAEERILQKFVADKVAVIFVFPSEVVALAKAMTQGTDIPMVFSHTNIEGTGLISDAALSRIEILSEVSGTSEYRFEPLRDSE